MDLSSPRIRNPSKIRSTTETGVKRMVDADTNIQPSKQRKNENDKTTKTDDSINKKLQANIEKQNKLILQLKEQLEAKKAEVKKTREEKSNKNIHVKSDIMHTKGHFFSNKCTTVEVKIAN